MFEGFVELGDTFPLTVLARNGEESPVTLDSLPTYRVYGPSGFITGQSGSLSLKDSKTVTGADNTTPIAITCNLHGYSTGDRITISGVTGNENANGTFTITSTGDNSFTLDGSSGSGTYAGGGTAHITGLYEVDIACTSGNGYEVGETYSVLVNGETDGDSWADLYSFGVT